MKQIHILMTKFNNAFSDIYTWLTKTGYNHVSIALDDEEVYYSFNYKGFAIERPKFENNRYVKVKKMLKVSIKVPDEVHDALKASIEKFVDQREDFAYTNLGVVLCYLNIPHRFKKRYFCSQFVMELLKKHQIAYQGFCSTCKPHHFDQKVKYLYEVKQKLYKPTC